MTPHLPANEVVQLQWPPDRFFWAVVRVPGAVRPVSAGGFSPPSRQLSRCGLVPVGVVAEVVDQLPMAFEDLHAVCIEVPEGLLVCAAPIESLHGVTADRLTPAAVPEDVVRAFPDSGSAVPEPDLARSINLLIGSFEPARLRRARTRARALRLGAIAVATVLLVHGFLRRADHWRDLSDQARERSSALTAEALGPALPSAALEAEAARLQHARRVVSTLQSPPDAGLALGAILRKWPTDVRCEPQMISVTERTASVAVLVRPSEDTPGASETGASFLTAFEPPPGWALHEPRLTTGAGYTRILIDLTRKPQPSEGK